MLFNPRLETLNSNVSYTYSIDKALSKALSYLFVYKGLITKNFGVSEVLNVELKL